MLAKDLRCPTVLPEHPNRPGEFSTAYGSLDAHGVLAKQVRKVSLGYDVVQRRRGQPFIQRCEVHVCALLLAGHWGGLMNRRKFLLGRAKALDKVAKVSVLGQAAAGLILCPCQPFDAGCQGGLSDLFHPSADLGESIRSSHAFS